MNESRDPAFPVEPAPGSDEALSAYLLCELDEAAVAAFERRLSTDPTLAARLDTLAGALMALGAMDEVDEPAGFADRLEARLEAERAAPSLDARRRRQRWSAVLTAAASVTVLAVAGLQVLAGGSNDLSTGGELEMAQEESAFDGQALDDAAGGATAQQRRQESAPDGVEDLAEPVETTMEHTDAYASDEGGGAGASAGGDTTNEPAPAPASGSATHSAPLILDEGAALNTDEELRARFAGMPESEQLRGMRRDEAAETAVRHEGIVREAGPFASGVRPDACLDEVRGGPDGRVVARVELLRWQGGEALAYVIGLAGPGSGHVDRYELWLVGPQGCDTRRFLTWE